MQTRLIGFCVVLALLMPSRADAAVRPGRQIAALTTAPDRAIDAIALLLRALSQPDVQPIDVALVWIAAELEASPRVDPTLILALGWPESRYQPTAGPACGVMQVYPHDIGLADAPTCALWRHDVRAGVRGGVLEIEMLLADHRVHSLWDALLYRACGNKAFTGECDRAGWVNQVLARRVYLAHGAPPKV